MCSINHDLKAIFIHVHKTGGTYVSYMLNKYYGFKNYYLRRPDHDKFCLNKKKTTKYINYENRIYGVYLYYKTSNYINKKMNMTPQKWDRYYKFCFIRNPYDKIVSAWFHINRYNIPFKNYLNLTNVCNDVEYMHMFLPQARNIINEKRKLNINYIGKFENLESDFIQILKNIGIKNIIHDSNKKLNKRDHMEFYKYYDQETLNIVNNLLKEDFYYLNYKKFDDINLFINTFENNDNISLEQNQIKTIDENSTLKGDLINTFNEKTPLKGDLINTLEQSALLKDNFINTFNEETPLKGDLINTFEQSPLLKDDFINTVEQSALLKDDLINTFNEETPLKDDFINTVEQSPLLKGDLINTFHEEMPSKTNSLNTVEQSPLLKTMDEESLLKQILTSNINEDFYEKNNEIKICCLYVYYEKDIKYKFNFMYFLDNAILDDIDYYIIINGKSSVNINKKDNIKIFYRENYGYDFGAYSHVIKYINKIYDYYFFINTSVLGPFLINNNDRWVDYFIKLFKKNVKIVGTSINIYKKYNVGNYNLINIYGKKNVFSHVQTMFFCIDNEYFNYLNYINFFNEDELKNKDFNYIITYKELGLSQIALNNNWNINCILQNYQNLDYRRLNYDINIQSKNGDPYYNNSYFGKNIKKDDVIFYKMNRF